MARRAKVEAPPAPEPAGPRAKALRSASAARALARYAAASAAFDTACEDRCGLGRIDTSYADLAEAAANVIRALLEESPGWMSAALRELVSDYAHARRVGDRAEDDVRVASLALREASAGASDVT